MDGKFFFRKILTIIVIFNFQDWFNLNINISTLELKDIHKECKYHLSSGLPYEESLCCQVSIMQGERAQVIEIWQIRLEPQVLQETFLKN